MLLFICHGKIGEKAGGGSAYETLGCLLLRGWKCKKKKAVRCLLVEKRSCSGPGPTSCVFSFCVRSSLMLPLLAHPRIHPLLRTRTHRSEYDGGSRLSSRWDTATYPRLLLPKTRNSRADRRPIEKQRERGFSAAASVSISGPSFRGPGHRDDTEFCSNLCFCGASYMQISFHTPER